MKIITTPILFIIELFGFVDFLGHYYHLEWVANDPLSPFDPTYQLAHTLFNTFVLPFQPSSKVSKSFLWEFKASVTV